MKLEIFWKTKVCFRRYSQLAKNTKEKQLLNFIFAVICLRKSIFIMNELLFMAILEDKLPKVDESNMLTHPKFFSNLVRKGLEVTCLVNKKNEGLLYSSWLFFMNQDQRMKNHQTNLNFCLEKKVSVTQDYGEELTILADNIDVNLNPFANLLEY